MCDSILLAEIWECIPSISTSRTISMGMSQQCSMSMFCLGPFVKTLPIFIIDYRVEVFFLVDQILP